MSELRSNTGEKVKVCRKNVKNNIKINFKFTKIKSVR